MLKSQNILAAKVKSGKSDKWDDLLDEQAGNLFAETWKMLVSKYLIRK